MTNIRKIKAFCCVKTTAKTPLPYYNSLIKGLNPPSYILSCQWTNNLRFTITFVLHKKRTPYHTHSPSESTDGNTLCPPKTYVCITRSRRKGHERNISDIQQYGIILDQMNSNISVITLYNPIGYLVTPIHWPWQKG